MISVKCVVRAPASPGRARRALAPIAANRGPLRAAELLIATVASSGCGDGARGALTVADSAGVEIVTNLPGSIESADSWSLSLEPVVGIGAGASPEVALYRVTAVVPLAGGRVAVGTNSPPRALIFEADGTLATTLGREGEGPGELASVGSVVELSPDSVAVWDPDRRRLSVFTADGRLAREVDLSAIAPVSTRAAGDASMASGFVHLLPSTPGSLVLWAEGVIEPAAEEPGVVRPELPAYRISPDGGELASFGSIPGMTVSVGRQTGNAPLPFGARTRATTAGDAFVVGTAESAEFRVFAPTGDLARIVRWPDGDREVGGPFLSRWTEMLESAPPGIRDFVELVPRPERFPAYEDLVSTDAGEILVGDYAGPLGLLSLRRADGGPEAFQPQLRVPARRWLVFDPGGVLIASVGTPEGFEPSAVAEGLLWGVYTDEVDVESVRAYGLDR